MTNRTESAKAKGKAVATSEVTKKGGKRPREETSRPRKSVEKPRNPLHESLAKCKVLSTRFIDWTAMARLGVKADMEEIFTGMGVNDYMHRIEFTHPDETIQFIRTLAAHGGPDDPSSDEEKIHFRIHGKSYELTHRDIREIYGFKLMMTRWDDESDVGGLSDLWERVATGPFRMGKSKGSTIRNPTIKLLQRALGFSFFGRHEVGSVILSEWRMISSALRPMTLQMEPALRHIPSVDPTVIFISNLFKAKDTAAKGKQQDWPLCIGGVLTPIFRHCGVQLSAPIRPVPLIDIQHLYSCRFLSPERGSIFLYPFTWAGQQMELPMPFRERDLVTCSIPGNIAFEHTPAHLGEHAMTVYQGPDTRSSSSTARASYRYDEPMMHPPQRPFEQEVAKQIGLLKRWNKWQDRCMRKMAAHIARIKKKCTCHGETTGVPTSARRERSHSPESSNPSLDLSPPPSDHESDA